MNNALNMPLTALTAALGLSLCLSVQTHAAEFTVNSAEDNFLWLCSDLDDSTLTLREAICKAEDTPTEDTITFDASLSGETLTLTEGDIDITRPITISGLGQAETIISGGAEDVGQGNVTDRRIFNVRNSALTLNDLTLTQGNANYGGAIYALDSSITATDSTFSGNTADRGGAIYATRNSSITATDSTFSGNTADSGGAIYASSNSTITATESTFSGNSAKFGGAIDAYFSTITATDSTFSGNTASRGGAIFALGSTITATDSTFSGNEAERKGGAIYAYFSTITASNSTFSGNSAAEEGGAIYARYGSNVEASNSTFSGNTGTTIIETNRDLYDSSSSLQLNSCTLTANEASEAVILLADVSGDNQINNTVVAGNTTPDDLAAVDIELTDGSDISISYSLLGVEVEIPETAIRADVVNMDTASEDLLGQDPKFRPLSTVPNQPSVHYMLADSPLIDAGDASAVEGTGVVSLTDQLGRARLNGLLDIGAVEYIAGDDTLDLSTGAQPVAEEPEPVTGTEPVAEEPEDRPETDSGDTPSGEDNTEVTSSSKSKSSSGSTAPLGLAALFTLLAFRRKR